LKGFVAGVLLRRFIVSDPRTDRPRNDGAPSCPESDQTTTNADDVDDDADDDNVTDTSCAHARAHAITLIARLYCSPTPCPRPRASLRSPIISVVVISTPNNQPDRTASERPVQRVSV